jgi:hypothetical protein
MKTHRWEIQENKLDTIESQRLYAHLLEINFKCLWSSTVYLYPASKLVKRSIKQFLVVEANVVKTDRLCGLVVRVLGYRSGGPGSIPGTIRKKQSGSGTRSTQPREYNWGATWYKSSGSCLEIQECGRRDPSRWPRGTLYPQKLAITSPTSGGRSVGIILSLTQTMEFSFFQF